MAYHVTILRTQGHATTPIQAHELSALASALTGWHYDVNASCLVSKGNIEELILRLQNGVLWTKNPNDAQIARMIEIAGFLNARVRGDEMETYRTVSETFLHPDDFTEKQTLDMELERWLTKKSSTNDAR